MKKVSARAAAALAALSLSAFAAAPAMAQGNDNGVWLVRAHAMNLHSANNDGTGLGLSINNKTFPEFDITYFFTPNLATELVLTIPQKQTVHSTVVGSDIGTFKHLPPVLTFQYHFTGLPVRPYVGAGLNLTLISNVNLLNGGATLDKHSVGLAVNAGVDMPLGGGWLVNLDVKKVQIKSDVYVGGANKGTLKLDPTLFSVGVGYRF
jgi:outer membrane protein